MVPRLLLLLPLIALAAGITPPRSAMGSCGDWLEHVADSRETHRVLGTENVAGRQSQSTPLSPCQGPHCQRSPRSPLQIPIPAPIGERHSDGVAFLTARQPFFFSGTTRPIFESSLHLTRGGLLRIDRPPIS